MPVVTQQEFKKLVRKRPEGVEAKDIYDSLVKRGYEIEGVRVGSPQDSAQPGLAGGLKQAAKIGLDVGEGFAGVMGKTVGGLIGKPTEFIGKKTGSDFVERFGQNLQTAGEDIMGAPQTQGEQIARGVGAGAGVMANLAGASRVGLGALGAKAVQAVGGGKVAQLAGSALAASPLETAVVTEGLEGRLPSKGELGVGAGVDVLAPAALRGAGKLVKKALYKGPVDEIIEKGIEKGIRPSIAGKSRPGDSKKYMDQAKTAVKTIVENKEALSLVDEAGERVPGKLPESLKEFSDAVGQAKKLVFDEYDSLTKAAGQKGATVDVTSFSEELAKVADSKVLQDLRPEVVKYAQEKMKSLAKRGSYSAEEAQEAITLLNKSLESFYRNPSPEGLVKASVDALIVNNLRKGLDDVIEKMTGKEYQTLKNQYGALKSIEKDVVKRSIVDARKNQAGLIDFTDIFSSGDIISGIATMNPALVAKGGAQMAIKNYFKKLNDPNEVIKKMFSGVDEAIERGDTPGLRDKIVQQILQTEKSVDRSLVERIVSAAIKAAGTNSQD